MKKFIFIDNNGIPIHTAVPSVDTDYTEGTAYGNTTCLEIPIDSDDSYYLQSMYWKGIWKTKPVSPSPFHIWNSITEDWEDTRTLQDFKTTQWELIKRERGVYITSVLVTPFGVFDTDSASQKAITDSVLMLQTLVALGTPETIDFTLHDNTTVTLTAAQMTQVGLILGARTQAAFAKSRVLRASIDLATTSAAVQAITWN